MYPSEADRIYCSILGVNQLTIMSETKTWKATHMPT